MKDLKSEHIKTKAVFDVENNLTDSAVTISDSKARLIYKEFIEKRNDLALFSLFVSVFVSTLISILTASFRDIFNIPNSSHMLLGAFIVVCFVSFVLAIVFFVMWMVKRKKYNENRFIQELHQRGKEFEKEIEK